MRKLIRVLMLVGLGVPAFANPGDSVGAVTQLIMGPVSYLIIAIGALYTLYQFARGHKQAAFFALGGLIFLEVVRTEVPVWMGSGQINSMVATPLGEFPVYGQTSALLTPGNENAYNDVRAWGYVGLFLCNKIITLLFSIFVPVLIGLIGGLYTYWKIVVHHHPGSVVRYVITFVLVSTFAIIPWFVFQPVNVAAIQSNDVVVGIQSLSQSSSQVLSTNNNMEIPALPAFILVGGVDVTEAIGNAINTNPITGNAAALLKAARASQLPEQWLPEYASFASQCAAAQQGFMRAEITSSTSGTAKLTATALKSGVQQMVNGSSSNALSSWGDNLFAWVPLYGYTLNSDQAYSQLHSPLITSPAKANDAMANLNWVPSRLSISEETGLPLHPGRVGFGEVGPGQFSIAPSIEIPANDDYYVLPKGTSNLLPQDSDSSDTSSTGSPTVAVVYCSVPDPTNSRGAFGPNTVSITDNANSTPQQTGFSLGFSFPGQSSAPANDDSKYLEDVVNTKTPSRNGGTVNIDEIDWGNQVRTDLLTSYLQSSITNTFCQTACPDVGNKYYWGCLITGQFIILGNADPAHCQSAANLTKAFYSPVGSSGNTYAEQVFSSFYGFNATGFAKPRNMTDVDSLQTAVLYQDPSWTQNPHAVRAAVDLIMGAPGSYSQNELAVDPANLPQSENTSFSLWTFMRDIAKSGYWLLSCFASVAAFVIQLVWPHFMGITILVFLLIYPIFSMIALWPGRWMVLLDWARGMLWVLLWAPIISLGFAFINCGAYLTQVAGFNQALPGPGHAMMTIIGAAFIFMAPPIAGAILHPCYSTLSQLGASVYGTGFKVVGMATTLAITALGAAAALGAGAAGAAKGASDASKPDAAKSDGTGPSAGASPGGGAGAASSATSGSVPASRLSRTITGATTWGSRAFAVSRAANAMAMTGMEAIDGLGLAGGTLGQGARHGARLGEAGTAVGEGVALAGWGGARMLAGQVARRAQVDGQGTNSAVRRIAHDIAGGTGGSLSGAVFGLGALLERDQSGGRFSAAGDLETQGRFAASNMSAQRESYTNAVSSGDANAKATALRAFAGFAQDGAIIAAQQGQVGRSAELMKQRADALTAVAAGSWRSDDVEGARTAINEASGVARDVEDVARRRGDPGLMQSIRRTRADLRGQEALVNAGYAQHLEAEADQISKSASNPSVSEPQRRTLTQLAMDHRRDAARLRTSAATSYGDAMRGYADGMPALERDLAGSATHAGNDNPAGIQAANGHALGLVMTSRQATALTGAMQATGLSLPPLPEAARNQLSWNNVVSVLAAAQESAGPVGRQTIEAIRLTGEGNGTGAARALDAAAISAEEVSAGHPRSSMARYAVEIRAQAAGMSDRLAGPTGIDGLNALARQVGGRQGVAAELDGLRSFAPAHIVAAVAQANQPVAPAIIVNP